MTILFVVAFWKKPRSIKETQDWGQKVCMEDGEVEDGKNAHDLYRIVNDLSSIIQICHTLDV